MSKVTIYTTETCGFCHMAKQYLKEKNIAFEEKNVAEDMAAAEEAVAKSGQMGVPVLDIDGEIVIGFDRPRIQSLLGI